MGKLDAHVNLPHLSLATRLMVQEQAFPIAAKVIAMLRSYKALAIW